jgi:hypothetical protein
MPISSGAPGLNMSRAITGMFCFSPFFQGCYWHALFFTCIRLKHAVLTLGLTHDSVTLDKLKEKQI